ncbi:MAG TPA: hypothetical protein VGV09_20370 [Steroidobacteraceae bacterium]|nr:hypothetical protein [Steroidobacteraceae bacterium]
MAIAIPPRIITKIIAMGVIHARIFDCKAVAPVKNGDSWATHSVGSARSATDQPTVRAKNKGERAVDIMGCGLRDRMGTMSPEDRVTDQRS